MAPALAAGPWNRVRDHPTRTSPGFPRSVRIPRSCSSDVRGAGDSGRDCLAEAAGRGRPHLRPWESFSLCARRIGPLSRRVAVSRCSFTVNRRLAE